MTTYLTYVRSFRWARVVPPGDASTTEKTNQDHISHFPCLGKASTKHMNRFILCFNCLYISCGGVTCKCVVLTLHLTLQLYLLLYTAPNIFHIHQACFCYYFIIFYYFIYNSLSTCISRRDEESYS